MNYLIALFVLLGVALGVSWVLMLAVGNFGFGEFGFVDCLPAGLLIGWVGMDTVER